MSKVDLSRHKDLRDLHDWITRLLSHEAYDTGRHHCDGFVLGSRDMAEAIQERIRQMVVEQGGRW